MSPVPSRLRRMCQRFVCMLFALGSATFGAPWASAAPVSFETSSYSTLAFASALGAVDGPNFASSASDPLPLTSVASIPDAGNGGASAGAAATAALLAVESLAAGFNEVSQATAVSTFLGDFVAPGGQLVLSLDLASNSDDAGAGLATLLVTLFLDGASVYEDVISVEGLYEKTFVATAGTNGTLELTLNSETMADAGAFGGNRALLRFGIAQSVVGVSAPGVLSMLFLGAGLSGVLTLRKRNVGA